MNFADRLRRRWIVVSISRPIFRPGPASPARSRSIVSSRTSLCVSLRALSAVSGSSKDDDDGEKSDRASDGLSPLSQVTLEERADYSGIRVTATNTAMTSKIYSALSNSQGYFALAGMVIVGLGHVAAVLRCEVAVEDGGVVAAVEVDVGFFEEVIGEHAFAVAEEDLEEAAGVVVGYPPVRVGLNERGERECRGGEQRQQEEIDGLAFHASVEVTG